MNTLERTLIEKAGYAHGWENVRQSTPERVMMYSARHKAEVHVTPTDTAMIWQVNFPKGPPTAELARTLPEQHTSGDTFQATDEASLGRLLRRAAELAMSLPNQAADHYATETAKLDANPPSTTEVLALVKQRQGQDIFRAALMDYWGGTCAVSPASSFPNSSAPATPSPGPSATPTPSASTASTSSSSAPTSTPSSTKASPSTPPSSTPRPVPSFL